ncbi:unnamed protein product [Pedinophyceae sp. YPF-701]|nr:unnamed protein product [Pedinophyceae sp. YPF-701]
MFARRPLGWFGMHGRAVSHTSLHRMRLLDSDPGRILYQDIRARAGKPWSHARRRGGEPALPEARILVIDGTNLLFHCFGLAKRYKQGRSTAPGTAPHDIYRRWVERLERRLGAAMSISVFDPERSKGAMTVRTRIKKSYGRQRPDTAKNPQRKDAKHVSRAITKPENGFWCIAPGDMYEADDGIAAVCREIASRHPDVPIAVVSGDTDMCQVLATPGGNVWWLRISGSSSSFPPEPITPESFHASNGFPPSAAPCLFALRGHREKGVTLAQAPSVQCAKRLLVRFGSIEGIVAAGKAGTLRHWGPQVSKIFSEADARTVNAFLKNRDLFRLHSNPDEVLRRDTLELMRGGALGAMVELVAGMKTTEEIPGPEFDVMGSKWSGDPWYEQQMSGPSIRRFAMRPGEALGPALLPDDEVHRIAMGKAVEKVRSVLEKGMQAASDAHPALKTCEVVSWHRAPGAATIDVAVLRDNGSVHMGLVVYTAEEKERGPPGWVKARLRVLKKAYGRERPRLSAVSTDAVQLAAFLDVEEGIEALLGELVRDLPCAEDTNVAAAGSS